MNAPVAPPVALSSHAPLGQGAFIVLVAGLMALNALAIDIMLPALPLIGADLGVAAPNDRQLVIVAYLAGFGSGQLLVGPISDRFGRKPVLFAGLLIYVAGAALSAAAPGFETLLLARVAQGLGSAAPRVVVLAIVRDCYEGRGMARVMSLAMMVFMAVPVLAPALGQVILLAAPWRAIFAVLALFAATLLAVCVTRLPETLAPERRRGLRPASLAQGLGHVLRSRQTMGYALAAGVFFGALFGFLASSQQILAELYGLGVWFPAVFAVVALAMGAMNFVNSRMVERLGMRLLSHGALAGFTVLSGALSLIALRGAPPIWLFLLMLGGAMMLIGLVFANFNALAMEPQAAVAGLASSFIGGFTTLIGAGIGFLIGAAYDGTVLPLTLGYAGCGLGALAILAVTERGRLFAQGSGG
jgi:DHA1 family bicyclomycin/chloramphenicol resistance-like MFS transporter